MQMPSKLDKKFYNWFKTNCLYYRLKYSGFIYKKKATKKRLSHK